VLVQDRSQVLARIGIVSLQCAHSLVQCNADGFIHGGNNELVGVGRTEAIANGVEWPTRTVEIAGIPRWKPGGRSESERVLE
jgi:hypothetical protein